MVILSLALSYSCFRNPRNYLRGYPKGWLGEAICQIASKGDAIIIPIVSPIEIYIPSAEISIGENNETSLVDFGSHGCYNRMLGDE
ncbi:MAG: hypothetical protein PWQ32_948 [Thermococcaceae archaeon]|nr:hypothetical protein [Thermococcaceae archaeon]